MFGSQYHEQTHGSWFLHPESSEGFASALSSARLDRRKKREGSLGEQSCMLRGEAFIITSQ